MSDEQLKADIADAEDVFNNRSVRHDWPAAVDAWNRIRARLEAVPDRESLTAVLQDAALARAINIDHYDARLIVDAVIAAIRGDKA